MNRITYLSGLALGQAMEFTAFAVLERAEAPGPDKKTPPVPHYAVRHLERFPVGTPYGEMFAQVASRYVDKPLRGTPLVVDQTGVGRAVLDLLRKSSVSSQVKPVTVTTGFSAGSDDHGGWLVPKKDLVGVLQVLLQARRLKVAPDLPDAALLLQELMTFQTRAVPAGSDLAANWREAPHDDLVFAVAIAAWQAERFPPIVWKISPVIPHPLRRMPWSF